MVYGNFLCKLCSLVYFYYVVDIFTLLTKNLYFNEFFTSTTLSFNMVFVESIRLSACFHINLLFTFLQFMSLLLWHILFYLPLFLISFTLLFNIDLVPTIWFVAIFFGNFVIYFTFILLLYMFSLLWQIIYVSQSFLKSTLFCLIYVFTFFAMYFSFILLVTIFHLSYTYITFISLFFSYIRYFLVKLEICGAH